MKLFFKIIKKIIISIFVIYLFNYLFVKYNLIIPINTFTVLFTSFFGTFGLLALFIFKLLVL